VVGDAAERANLDRHRGAHDLAGLDAEDLAPIGVPTTDTVLVVPLEPARLRRCCSGGGAPVALFTAAGHRLTHVRFGLGRSLLEPLAEAGGHRAVVDLPAGLAPRRAC